MCEVLISKHDLPTLNHRSKLQSGTTLEGGIVSWVAQEKHKFT
jgi:hypothetical protein